MTVNAPPRRPGLSRFAPTVAGRLLAAFLLIGLLPVATLLAVSYSITEDAMTRAVEANLVALGDARASQIETYVLERQRAVTVLARQPEIVRALTDMRYAAETNGIDTAPYRDIERRHRPTLARFIDVAAFTDLFLITDSGDVVFSVRHGPDLGTNYYTGPYAGTELAKVFDRAKTLMGTEMSEFAQHPTTQEAAAFLASPVLYNGIVIGVVAVQMSNVDFYNLVADYTGLGHTGETVVGTATPGGVTIVAPLRNDPDAPFRRVVPRGNDRGSALVDAAHGRRGFGIVQDYRGHRVVAAWRYLPSFSGGMVVKIDAAEALAPVRRQLDVLLLITGAILGVAVVTAIVMARTIATPLRRLTAAARAVAAGDLDQTVPVTRHDEIGIFTSTFNQMMTDLRRMYETIEDTVVERTEQLRHETETVRQLNRQIMESIAYAARIQRSLLPQFDTLARHVDGLSVRWEPRDVVGGDFYWWHETPDGYTLVLADCTGHGVPGAFMTIIVAGALDRLRQENRLKDPASALADLHRLVKRALHQAGGNPLAEDGLDAAVCHVSITDGTLTFAGARLSIVVSEWGTWHEIRGDRKSIGYRSVDIGEGFTNHSLPLTPAMEVWLYTDGLTDQLGSARGIAFGRRRLRNVLASTMGGVTERSAAVLGALADYQGGMPRLDDITLIGFRPRPSTKWKEPLLTAGNAVKAPAESC